jgi:DNA-binding response OmpR family regulator
MRVLVVEDEPAAARLLAKGLRENAYAVDVARDGLAAHELLTTAAYDVVILDVMLPRKDGLELCREIRAAGSRVPVLMVTARDAVDARIAGLDSGADDYLVKPFAFGELLARVRALVRRREQPVAPEQLTAGSIQIDTRTRSVFVEGTETVFTPREYALLEFFCRHVGVVVTRQQIAEHVWDDRYDPLSNVIDVYVQRLRRKIDTPGQLSLIRAHRGAGYQFMADGQVT